MKRRMKFIACVTGLVLCTSVTCLIAANNRVIQWTDATISDISNCTQNGSSCTYHTDSVKACPDQEYADCSGAGTTITGPTQNGTCSINGVSWNCN